MKPPVVVLLLLALAAVSAADVPPVFRTLKDYDPASIRKPDPKLLGVNVLENAGFENGLKGWRVTGEAEAIPKPAHNGRGAARLVNTTYPDRDGRLIASATVPGGGTYEASVWAYSPKGTQDVNVKFELWGPDNKYLTGHRSERFAVPEGAWMRITYAHKLPPFERVRVQVLYRLWSAGPVLFDDAAFKMVREQPLYLPAEVPGSRLVRTSGLLAWTAPFPTRITADHPVDPAAAEKWPKGGLELTLAGNERGVLPVFFTASADPPSGVTLRVADERGAEIADVSVCALEPLQYLGELYYDVLVPSRGLDLKRGQSKMFWFEFAMPPGPKRRPLSGAIEIVRSGDDVSARIPFQIKTFDFDLPRQPSLPFAVGVPRMGRRPSAAQLDAWWRDIARNRMSVRNVGRPPLRFDGDKAVFDFREFDASLDKALSLGMGLFQLPHAYVVGGHDRKFSQTFGPLALGKVSDPFRVRFVNAMRTLAEHLEARGVLRNFNHNIWDEPYPKHYEQLKEIATLMQKAHPGYMPSSFVTSRSGKYDLTGYIREAITHAGNFPPDRIWRQKQRGDIISIYNPFDVFAVTNRPELVRGFLWWAYRTQIDRIYQWCIGPWREVRGRPGMSRADYGHCWVYQVPGQSAFLRSVRFVMAREGSEDVDYLTRLEQELDKVKAGLGVDVDVRAIAGQVAGIVLGADYRDFSTDPQAYEDVRRAVAEMIPKLSREPLVLWRRTFPKGARQAYFEVWKEPDARLTLNGARLAHQRGKMWAGEVDIRKRPVELVVERNGKKKTIHVPVK